MGLRYKKANVTHPELNVTVQLPIMYVISESHEESSMLIPVQLGQEEPPTTTVHSIGCCTSSQPPQSLLGANDCLADKGYHYRSQRFRTWSRYSRRKGCLGSLCSVRFTLTM